VRRDRCRKFIAAITMFSVYIHVSMLSEEKLKERVSLQPTTLRAVIYLSSPLPATRLSNSSSVTHELEEWGIPLNLVAINRRVDDRSVPQTILPSAVILALATARRITTQSARKAHARYSSGLPLPSTIQFCPITSS
jgi:hypothetical protein